MVYCRTLYFPTEFSRGGVAEYTFRKFRRFIPYTCLAVFLEYFVVRNPITSTNPISIFNAISEIFMLNAACKELGQTVGALWYLTALLVAFPVICILCENRKNGFVRVVTYLLPIIYYSNIDTAIRADIPWNIVRVIAGMCIGIVIRNIQEEYEHKGVNRTFSWMICIASLLTPIVMGALSFHNRRIFLFCFIVFVFLATRSCNINGNRVTFFLGNISMGIFILHWAVGDIVLKIFGETVSSLRLRGLIYFTITFMLTIMMYLIVNKVKLWSGKNGRKI